MNFGKTALQVLKTVAPTLALAVGGPFGPLAAAALHAALGTTDQASAEAALVNATPDQLLALKKADQDFAIRMKELGISEEKLVFDDLASARQMQIATKDPTPARLAWLVVGGFLIFSMAQVVALIGWPDQLAKVPAAAWGTIGTILGYLAKEASQASAFYFGSSAGSQAKDATISDMAKQP